MFGPNLLMTGVFLNQYVSVIPRFMGVRQGDEWLYVIQSLGLPRLALRDDAGRMDGL